jgi:ornithine cyclodeaminase/alanine dehydrogenase-like protein (mu-crystallin family)
MCVQFYKQQVTVWSRTYSSAEKCAADIGGVACHTAEEAVKDADVIFTVTASTTPILEKSWVKSNAHVNGILYYYPSLFLQC